MRQDGRSRIAVAADGVEKRMVEMKHAEEPPFMGRSGTLRNNIRC
jgi:hypothetical protein